MSEVLKSWDYLILTASNPEQASAYRCQIDLRQKLGFLSGIKNVLVLPDPDGHRVGSAGSTIFCLMKILDREMADHDPSAAPNSPELWTEKLAQLRILIVHAGGDSKRLPAYGPCGKAFIPLPGESDRVLVPTIFDRQLPVYLRLPEGTAGKGQIVITTGDVLLDFDPSEIQFDEDGVTGVGCLASPELAKNHGVFVSNENGSVRLFLQKPSVADQIEMRAVDQKGHSLLDIGILNFNAASAVKLLSLAEVQWSPREGFAWNGPIANVIREFGLDLYLEICCAMGTDVDFSQYRKTIDESGTPMEESCLRRIFETMSDTAFLVRTLSRCDFLHFGTMRQLLMSGLELVCRDHGTQTKESIVSVNNRISDDGRICGENAWIEGCRIKAALELGGENGLVGVDIDAPLKLPEKACLDVIKGRLLNGERVSFIRIYGIDDRIKDTVASGTTICDIPALAWIRSMGATAEDLWEEGLPPEERSFWNARIFPAVKESQEYKDWLWLFDPQKATPKNKHAWHIRQKFSFQDMSHLVDQDEFYTRRVSHRCGILQQSLWRMFQPESAFSAHEMAFLCGQLDERVCSRLFVSLIKDLHDLQADASIRSGLARLKLSRVLHTIGTSIRISGEDYGVSWKKILQALQGILNESETTWLESFGLDTQRMSDPDEWIQRFQESAFANLSQTIVMSRGKKDIRPQNTLRRDEIIWGRAPVRLDLGGGWTDTPPYALEQGGRVLNAAVDLNGQLPIHVYARRIDALEVRIASIDHGARLTVNRLEDLLDYRQPTSEFALAKAALTLSGLAPDRASWPESAKTLQDILRLFGGGIELTTLAAIPSGSGLGTSSIMGAVLMSVIHRMMGRELSHRELFHSVLQLEQELTTGGGWQDQIGGTVAGVKMIETDPGIVPNPEIRSVRPDLVDPKCNGGQTLLYYTGMRRLAKNILRNVVGHYLDRDRKTMATLRKLHVFPTIIREALIKKDMKEFGERIDIAWQLNKEIDPDSSNRAIEEILSSIKPFMYGAKLLGAGGGGFLLVICRTPDDADKTRRLLEANPPNPLARFFEYTISHKGLEVTVC
jgi:fucokinase